MSEPEKSSDFAAQMKVFIKNRLEFSQDELAKHAGKWIAYSPDGTAIVASASDPEQLVELVRASGNDPERCVLSHVPGSDVDTELTGITCE